MLKRFKIGIAALTTILALACEAQSGLMLTSVAPFNATNGIGPDGELALGVDGLIHGTASEGAEFGFGDVFESTLDGAFTVLASFNGTNGSFPTSAPILTSSGDSYGTTIFGGNGFDGAALSGMGTIYKLDSNGILSSLLAFSGSNGVEPISLIPGSDGNLYGTAATGGAFTNVVDSFGDIGGGTVFRISTNGDFSLLISFDGTNGGVPRSLLLGIDGNFYGVTEEGGTNGSGTVFRISPEGNLTSLFSFSGTNGASPITLMQGSDGGLYGTTFSGGISIPSLPTNGYGTVFRITTNGDFTLLGLFNGDNGFNPAGRLTEVSNGVFYGTAMHGSGFDNNQGELFQITTNSGITELVPFGISILLPIQPSSGVLKAPDGNYYGAANNGLFAVRPIRTPVLQAGLQGGQINMSWQGWAGYGYEVFFKTNLTDPEWQLLNFVDPQTNGPASFSDPVGPDQQRFYQVTLEIP